VACLASDSAYLFKLIDIVSQHPGRAFPILISDEISATDYKRLTRGGGADWASANAAARDVLDIIARRREGAAAQANSGVPVIASFVPCAGGVGNTTLVVEVATTLKIDKAAGRRSICVVDLDFQTSHVCDHLDIEPRLQIHEISSNPERLDGQLLEIYISRHESGLHVFAAPRAKFDVCNLNLSALDAFFNLISTRYDLIIIDFPTTWFGWTSRIVSGSDGVIVTGVNTIPGLRQMVETVAVVRDARHPSAKIAMALNRCEQSFLGGIARRHHVEKVLGEETLFYVRHTAAALQSINTGTPLALGRGTRRTSKDIAAIAEFCAELKSLRVAARAA
jgi:pilus assembly protein CpaE